MDADLVDTNLVDADLVSADLVDANLEDVNLDADILWMPIFYGCRYSIDADIL